MIRLVIFDLDGTLYRGNEPIAGAIEAVQRLRDSGILVRFLTNNSALTHAQIAERLCKIGFRADANEVAGTGPYAAEVCRKRGLEKPFVVGEPGLHQAFAEQGYEPLLTGERADVVVVGVCRQFTYSLCDEALQHILNGATFLATNRDATYPLEGNRVQPGAGAGVAAIQAASQTEPEVLGKPSPHLVRHLIVQAEVQPHECLVIGDRVDTDIEAGRAAGCETLLVLSGATTMAPEYVPSIYSVADLPALLSEAK